MRKIVLAAVLMTAACATKPVDPAGLGMKDLMVKVIDPASKAVFDLGNAEDASKLTSAQWAAGISGARSLQHTGKLLLVAPHLNPDPVWTASAQKMVDVGAAAEKAAREKSTDQAFTAGGDLYDACNACHAKFVHGKQ